MLAAVAHGELLTLAPFGSGDGVVARAVSRLVTMATGLDPHGLGVPEVYWMRRVDDYQSRGARRSRRVHPMPWAQWMLMCCRALEDGAREAMSIAEAASKMIGSHSEAGGDPNVFGSPPASTVTSVTKRARWAAWVGLGDLAMRFG